MSLYDTGLFVRGLYRGGLFDQSLWETAGSSIFDRLQDLDQPMVVAYEGANPLETGRYPQPTTVLAFASASNQYVSIADDPAFDIVDKLSVVATCKTTLAELTGSQYVVSKYTTAGDQKAWGFGYSLGTEKLKVLLSNDGDVLIVWESDVSVDVEEMNTIGFTFDSGDLKVYLNGVGITGSFTTGSAPTSLFVTSADVIIGGLNGGNAFDGVVGDVQIYDTIFSRRQRCWLSIMARTA